MKFKIGDTESISKTFTKEDVIKFSEISLDVNPIHLDEEYAKNTVFGKNIVHGILVSGLFSAIIANKLPGPGSIYLTQELNFKKPVFHDELVTAKVEIIDIRQDKPIIKLTTTAYNSNNELVIEGYAVVKVLS